MKREFSILMLALSSCAAIYQVGPVLFTTPCGMQVRGLIPDGGFPPEWSQERVNEAERYAVASYAKHSTEKQLCAKLRGWNLYPYPTETWVDPYGRSIAGLTNCSKGLTIIGAGDPRHWALAHDLGHIAQRCEAPLPIDVGLDDYHANWNRDGFYKAIDFREVEPGGVIR